MEPQDQQACWEADGATARQAGGAAGAGMHRRCTPNQPSSPTARASSSPRTSRQAAGGMGRARQERWRRWLGVRVAGHKMHVGGAAGNRHTQACCKQQHRLAVRLTIRSGKSSQQEWWGQGGKGGELESLGCNQGPSCLVPPSLHAACTAALRLCSLQATHWPPTLSSAPGVPVQAH